MPPCPGSGAGEREQAPRRHQGHPWRGRRDPRRALGGSPSPLRWAPHPGQRGDGLLTPAGPCPVPAPRAAGVGGEVAGGERAADAGETAAGLMGPSTRPPFGIRVNRRQRRHVQPTSNLGALISEDSNAESDPDSPHAARRTTPRTSPPPSRRSPCLAASGERATVARLGMGRQTLAATAPSRRPAPGTRAARRRGSWAPAQ